MKIIARYTRDSVWKFPRNSLGFAKSLSNNCRICVESLKIHLPFSYIFTSSSYSCYCIDGYTGRQCQTNWDECWSTPCLNGGTCIDGVASYNCTCSEGFNGMLQFSLSVPANRVALFIFFIFHLSPIFSSIRAGVNCEENLDECLSSPCQNGGTCDDRNNGYVCYCPLGYAGIHCELDVAVCDTGNQMIKYLYSHISRISVRFLLP